MNITKNDLFYVFMSIIVATIGVVAVSNANTKVGLYGLLGLLAIAVVMAIIIRPSLGANILVFAIFTNISDVLISRVSQGLSTVGSYCFSGTFDPLYLRWTITGLASQDARVEVFLLVYFMMVTASFLVASDKNSSPHRDLGLGERYGHYLLHHICVARFPVLETDYLADYYHNRGTLLLEPISTCYTQLYSSLF